MKNITLLITSILLGATAFAQQTANVMIGPVVIQTGTVAQVEAVTDKTRGTLILDGDDVVYVATEGGVKAVGGAVGKKVRYVYATDDAERNGEKFIEAYNSLLSESEDNNQNNLKIKTLFCQAGTYDLKDALLPLSGEVVIKSIGSKRYEFERPFDSISGEVLTFFDSAQYAILKSSTDDFVFVFDGTGANFGSQILEGVLVVGNVSGGTSEGVLSIRSSIIHGDIIFAPDGGLLGLHLVNSLFYGTNSTGSVTQGPNTFACNAVNSVLAFAYHGQSHGQLWDYAPTLNNCFLAGDNNFSPRTSNFGFGLISAPQSAKVENCKINADSIFDYTVGVPSAIRLKFYNCEFFNTAATGWFTGHTPATGQYEFINCRGVSSGAVGTANVVMTFCTDESGAVIPNQ